MLDKSSILFWNEVEHDLFQDGRHIFGVELDLCNGHQKYYCKEKSYVKEYFWYLNDDIYKAIEQFNSIVEEFNKIR